MLKKYMEMEQPLWCVQSGATRARSGNEFMPRTLRVHTGRMRRPKQAEGGKSSYRLTAKEQDVLLLLAVGMTRQEIAGQLNLTRPGLRTYVWRIRQKLAAKRLKKVVEN